MTRRLCLFGPVIFACSVQVFGQQATAAKTDNRVNLYVDVNDKSGKPVTGLQRQDFTILDNKQPQTIVSFQAVGQAPDSDNNAEVVLVLDAVNTAFARVAFARQQMDNFLRRDAGRLSRPVSIGIFADAGLELQPTSSSDGNALAAYLDQHETGLRTSNRSQGFYGASDRYDLSIRALQQIAAYAQNRPGRKLVIWVSPGWALFSGPRMDLTAKQQQGIFDTVLTLSTELRQSGTTMYVVNPLGNTESLERTFYYQQFLKKVTKASDAQFADLSLQVLAVHSGGLIMNGSNDITGEIARCARDANAYYVLSFNPPPADGPDFYNEIDVKLARRDLKAQTLAGFYAEPTVRRVP